MVARSHLVCLAVALGLGTGAKTADADTIAVADLTTDEHQTLAGALTLVLRNYVGNPANRVSRSKIAKAILEVGGGGTKSSLSVAPDKVADVLTAVSADRWIAGELRRVGVNYELSLSAHDRAGGQTRKTIRAPLADYETLAREGALAAARLVGAVALDRPAVSSLANMAAIGRASGRLAEGDTTGAANDMAAAPIRLGFELTSIRELLGPIASDKSIGLDLRMNAALVAGDYDAARKLASKTASKPLASALRARILIAKLDYQGAKRELATVRKSDHPFVVLARVALAAELGKGGELARAAAPLFGGKPYVPALALAATLRPGALGSQEKALLSAAAKISSTHPYLASKIAGRALIGGDRSSLVFELIDPLSSEERQHVALKKALGGLTDEKLKARIATEIALRDGDLAAARESARIALNLDPESERAQRMAAVVKEEVATAVEPTTPTTSGASKATLADPNKAAALNLLASDLMPLLEAFPSLKPEMGKVVVVPQEGSSELPLWPNRVHPERLRQGLEAALSGSPFGLATSTEIAELPEKPTSEALLAIARDNQAGGVLVYGVRTDGMAAKVRLLLFSTSTKEASTFTATLDTAREHGVVSWNPVFVITSASIVGILFLWLVWLVVRGTGSIRLELKGDPAAERPSFSVVISRRNKGPVVTDPKEHLANVTAEAKAGRYSAHNVGAVSEFERIPPGSWFVHVFGTFEKAGETRCLPATTAGAKVKRNRVSVVNVDLVPKESEFRVLVTGEGGPAAGAQLWLSTEPAKRYSADVGGKAVVFAPPGEHVLHVSFRGLEVKRNVTAYGSKVSTIHLNLVRERRLAEVAEGLDYDFGHAVEAGEPDASVSGLGNTAFPQLSEETPTPHPSPLVGGSDRPGPSVDSFRRAAEAQTTGLESGATLSGLRRYAASKELGRGAMGVVYYAVDQVLDRPVALKVMSSQLREHPGAAKMFEQEAKALAALNHPNVVAVYDQGRDGDQIFLVMEFVAGTTLEALLEERERLPLAEAANIGEKLGRSLSYAHSRMVIHRDIKPGNIFIGDDGAVKLGDFGLARVLKEVQIKQTEIKGTPLYMAPEQIRGSDIDFRADIYALGCTMYEVLAGRPPFIEGEILYHHIHTQPPPLSNFVTVPADVEQLIMKCIAKNKSERVASADRIAEVFGAQLRMLR